MRTWFQERVTFLLNVSFHFFFSWEWIITVNFWKPSYQFFLNLTRAREQKVRGGQWSQICTWFCSWPVSFQNNFKTFLPFFFNIEESSNVIWLIHLQFSFSNSRILVISESNSILNYSLKWLFCCFVFNVFLFQRSSVFSCRGTYPMISLS